MTSPQMLDAWLSDRETIADLRASIRGWEAYVVELQRRIWKLESILDDHDIDYREDQS